MHFASALFQSVTKRKLNIVLYKGGFPAMMDVIGGQAHVHLAVSVPAIPHLRAGRLRGLAVGTPKRADFVFTVARDFIRSVKTPLLIAPDDTASHPYKVAMEVASLAPNAEVTIYPWKDSQEHIEEVVAHARRFLKAHEPARV
jgi:hypothetical protein